MKNIKESFLTS